MMTEHRMWRMMAVAREQIREAQRDEMPLLAQMIQRDMSKFIVYYTGKIQ